MQNIGFDPLEPGEYKMPSIDYISTEVLRLAGFSLLGYPLMVIIVGSLDIYSTRVRKVEMIYRYINVP